MDFQRLFKPKQAASAPPFAGDDAGDALKDRDVIIRQGELWDGNSPAPVDWSKVGGAITVKAGKILGVWKGEPGSRQGFSRSSTLAYLAAILIQRPNLTFPSRLW
jgi:hypothetical protein